jgi:hypothetical protein
MLTKKQSHPKKRKEAIRAVRSKYFLDQRSSGHDPFDQIHTWPFKENKITNKIK